MIETTYPDPSTEPLVCDVNGTDVCAVCRRSTDDVDDSFELGCPDGDGCPCGYGDWQGLRICGDCLIWMPLGSDGDTRVGVVLDWYWAAMHPEREAVPA